MSLSPGLIELLACPVDHVQLAYDDQLQSLTCLKCHRQYPVIDDIPRLIPEDFDQLLPTFQSKPAK